jgi:hypothetical protein
MIKVKNPTTSENDICTPPLWFEAERRQKIFRLLWFLKKQRETNHLYRKADTLVGERKLSFLF